MPRTEIVGLGIRDTFTSLERVSDKPFKVVFVPQNATIYDDPDFSATIEITTFDARTGRRVGCRSHHTGRPGVTSKSTEWACGMGRPPLDMVASVTVTTSKSARWGLDLIEADERVPRLTAQDHHSIAFDEFDYAETGSSASTLAVTGVTVDAGDFLVALASVFNSSGNTMAVSDATNGTWTNAVTGGTSAPVLPDANSQAHIQYFANSAALSAATVTFNPVGTSSDIDAVVVEVSGAATSGFDQYVEATGATTTPTVTTGTLAQANNLIFSVATHTGADGITFTEGGAFTLIAEDTDNAASQAFHTQRLTTATAATTAVTVTMTLSSNVTWGIAAIVVKEADGGAATVDGPLIGGLVFSRIRRL